MEFRNTRTSRRTNVPSSRRCALGLRAAHRCTLCFRDRPLSLDDQADHAQALFLVRQAQKRAGMALGQVMLTQRLQNGRRMAQDAQLVCDGGLALADAAGSLLLAQMVLLHELLQALGLLDVIQIAPLQIFHQRQHPGRLLVHVRKQARDLRQSGQPRCAQAALSRHQLIRTARLADGQRLQNAVLPDAPGQLLQAARYQNACAAAWDWAGSALSADTGPGQTPVPTDFSSLA